MEARLSSKTPRSSLEADLSGSKAGAGSKSCCRLVQLFQCYSFEGRKCPAACGVERHEMIVGLVDSRDDSRQVMHGPRNSEQSRRAKRERASLLRESIISHFIGWTGSFVGIAVTSVGM